METAINIFLGTTAFLLAFVFPVFLICICGVMKEWKEQKEYMRDYKNFMKPDYWFFRGFEQCSNPTMVSVKIENSFSRETISIGIDKKDLHK